MFDLIHSIFCLIKLVDLVQWWLLWFLVWWFCIVDHCLLCVFFFEQSLFHSSDDNRRHEDLPPPPLAQQEDLPEEVIVSYLCCGLRSLPMCSGVSVFGSKWKEVIGNEVSRNGEVDTSACMIELPFTA